MGKSWFRVIYTMGLPRSRNSLDAHASFRQRSWPFRQQGVPPAATAGLDRRRARLGDGALHCGSFIVITYFSSSIKPEFTKVLNEQHLTSNPFCIFETHSGGGLRPLTRGMRQRRLRKTPEAISYAGWRVRARCLTDKGINYYFRHKIRIIYP